MTDTEHASMPAAAASTANAVGVSARDWGWRHASRKDFALRHVDFDIKPGERVLLLGASGAGKSTLMSGLAGVLGGDDEGESEGELLVGGVDARTARGMCGLVLQDPDAQTILERVGDDVAFGCENLNLPREETWRRVRESLDTVGLDYMGFDHSTRKLSGGQRQRLALAGALAMHPGLLLLDEPTANLDPDGVRQVHDAVRHVVERTHETLVVVEHHIDVWLDLVDRVIVLGRPDDGRHVGGVLADGDPDEVFGRYGDLLAESGAWVPGRAIADYAGSRGNDAGARPVGAASTRGACAGETVLYTRDLSFGRAFPLGEHIDVAFHAGEVTALTGRNGVGKSTLALTLAGLLKPIAGRVCVADELVPKHRANDVSTWKSRDLLGRIGMVFQEPEHQFVASSVRDEVAVGPRSMGKTEREAYAIADGMLERMNLARFAKANPFTLSGGEKRRLSVASMLAAAPKVLVMDEPTFGQDYATWNEMVRLIAMARDEGSAVIMVTHDEALVKALDARIVDVSEGER